MDINKEISSLILYKSNYTRYSNSIIRFNSEILPDLSLRRCLELACDDNDDDNGINDKISLLILDT